MSSTPVEELISFAQDEDTTTTSSISEVDISRTTTPPVMNMEPPKTAPLRTPQRRSLAAHGRSYSWVAPNNNLSLSFPISIASPTSPYVRMPQSASTSSPLSPFPSVIPNIEAIEPASDPEQFLVVLASQERRVLELREEITRADAELEKLKRKWALHEASKKRSDNHGHVRSTRKSEDLTVLRDAKRSSTVFAGNRKRTTTFSSNTRHQRTLSLLSPDRNLALSFPQPADLWEDNDKSEDAAARTRPTDYFDGAVKKVTPSEQDRRRAGHQEALIATGKQMAEDFKEGLWTFIEDLKQATVGEDTGNIQDISKAAPLAATSPISMKKKASKSTLKVNTTPATKSASTAPKTKVSRKSSVKATKLIDIGDDFWSELDPNGPLSSKKEEFEDNFSDEVFASKKSHKRPESIRWSSSTILSDMASGAMSPETQISTPRTSTSSFSRSNSPERRLSLSENDDVDTQKNTKELLQSLVDGQQSNVNWGAVGLNLKKTATALLVQVEKSLAPPINAYDAQKYNASNLINTNVYSTKSKNH